MSDSPVSVTENSQEDLRSTLFSELKERGLLSSIKAQLRGKVVQELQTLARDRPIARESVTQRWGRLCVSVLAEHLEMAGLEYTLSVLLIEGGCGREGIMGRKEIEGILGTDLRGTDSVLTYLVEEMAKERGITKRNIHTQTHKSHSERDCLEDKLMEIELAYSELSEREREYSHLSMQEKMLSFQRQCQKRANEQVKSEMVRYQERELASMRLECESKMQDEIAKSRRQTEAFYQERLKGLQQRERNLMDSMKNREKELDTTLFSQRQKILDELESVKNREFETRRMLEAENKGVKGERERLMCLEQNLKLRELNLENVSKQKELANDQVQKMKLVRLEKEYEDKIKSLELQEATLKEERRSLSQLEGICSNQIRESTELRSQLYKLQEVVHISTESQLCAEKDKASLNEKLERMSDYNLLKSENVRIENELYIAKLDIGKNTVIHEERFREYEIHLSDLRCKLQEPSVELHELRNKFASEKHNHDRENILNKQENKQLELNLETAMHQQRCLKDTLKDHQLLVKQLNHELSDLRVRTSSKTRSIAVRESTLFDPQPLKSSLRNQTIHSAPPIYTPPKEQPDLFHRPKSNKVRIKLPTSIIATETAFNDTADISQAGSEISFVQEAKASLERLEREAQELEHSYKKVHNRILRGTAVDTQLFQEMPYTSTLDPNAFLHQSQFDSISESGKEIQQLLKTTSDKTVPNFSLTSLTDINLTAGVNQSSLGEHDKSTDILLSHTTQDNFPSIPSYSQLVSNPTHVSLLSNSRELSQVSEVTSDEHINELVLSTNQSVLDVSHQISVSPETTNTLLDPIKLFHQLQDTSNRETDYFTTTPIRPDLPSQTLDERKIPLNNPTIHSNNSPSPKTILPGIYQPSTDSITTIKRSTSPIENIPSDIKQNTTDPNTIHIENNESLEIISGINVLSARARARDEAVRKAILESEHFEKMQAEYAQLDDPKTNDLNTSVKPIDELQNNVNPAIYNITALQADTPAIPVKEMQNQSIHESISLPEQVTTPVEISKELDSDFTPKSNINPIQIETPATPSVTFNHTTPETNTIQEEPGNTSEHTVSEQHIDPMARYMQLLANTNPTVPEKDTTKSNDDVISGVELSLKSDCVSFGAYSDEDKTEPFKDW